jgi:hypothetical protein
VHVWGEKHAQISGLYSLKAASNLVAQMKGEILMLVFETANGFRTTICDLRTLDESERVSFHTFSQPEDRCVRLLLKKLGKVMSEAEIRNELEDLHINVSCNSGRSDGISTTRKTVP